MPSSHVLRLYPFSALRVFLGVGSVRGQQQRSAGVREGVCASVQSRLARLRAAGVRLPRLFHVDRVSLEEHPSAHLPGGQPRAGGDHHVTVILIRSIRDLGVCLSRVCLFLLDVDAGSGRGCAAAVSIGDVLHQLEGGAFV